MVFGELVVPSTRALWDDDCAEFVEYDGPILEWDSTNLPTKICNLIVADTRNVMELLEKCVLKSDPPVNASKRAGIRLFSVENDNYLIVCSTCSVTSGEIIELIQPLINIATGIYGITSAPLSVYQGYDVTVKTTSLIRALTSQNVTDSIYPRLKCPNLITGITADLLSYCVHVGLQCQLFIGYLDAAPLDSVNSEPLMQLFRQLGVRCTKSYLLNMQAPSNNLYM